MFLIKTQAKIKCLLFNFKLKLKTQVYKIISLYFKILAHLKQIKITWIKKRVEYWMNSNI